MADYETLLALFEDAQRLHAGGDREGALALYDAILLEKADLAEVHNNKGVIFRELEKYGDALHCLDQAVALDQDIAEAHNNRGFVLTVLGRADEAMANLDRAIALKPDFPDAHNNRGLALRQRNRLDEALQSYDHAIALCPTLGEAWANRGKVFAARQELDPAIASFIRAVELMPRHGDTLLNCALALQKRGRFDEANRLLEQLSTIEPSHKHLLFGLAYGALQNCDWNAQDQLRQRLLVECPSGASLVQPLTLLGYFDDPEMLFAASAQYLKSVSGPDLVAAATPALRPHGKIRIAYVSGDFHEHATAHLIADLFERHDRSRFEVYGLSFGPDDRSPMRLRLARAFDRFCDVASDSDADVVNLVRGLEVDIAVDLKGFTFGERPGIFTRRAAPVQVNYLGYPGTMAADVWDYIIADPIVLPHAEQSCYAEQIVHLPGCYQANDPARKIGLQPTRASQGLPETGFIFCCFNNHWKITRPVFDIWMRLLKAMPGSVLWLIQGSAMETLRREAQARGIDGSRLIFAPMVRPEAHLARLGLADLVLDTLPYNAHTTASDALWAGVPMVTCRGKAFAGRVASSLLSAIGLPELIAEDLPAYEALARRIAGNTNDLDFFKDKLARNRHSAALFDADGFRRNIEQAFETMIERARKIDTREVGYRAE